MQSIWIGLLGILFVCALTKAIPVNSPQLDNDAETRIIIPPELPPHHFELLKEKSENQTNCSNDKTDDSTPLNFLRTTGGAIQNISTIGQQPIIAFEGNKQIPIYITIPIFVNPAYQPQPSFGVDNGAVVAVPAFNTEPQVLEGRAVTSKDVKKALKELVRDAYRQGNEERNFHGRKKVHRHRIYRD